MIQYKISDIINDVRKCIDEIGCNDAEFASEVDSSETEQIIVSKIIDALTFVNANADMSLLEPDETITSAIERYHGSDHKAITKAEVTLPSGEATFLRLLIAKALNWKRYLSQEDIIYWNDPEYLKLSYSWATGSNERPKVALIKDNGDKLEMFPYDNSIRVDIMVKPVKHHQEAEGSTPEYEYYNVSERVKEAFIYYLSGLVAATYGENSADTMFTLANTMLGIKTE